jgi:lipid kinase YegS
MIRIILNGKRADDLDIRNAVNTLREEGYSIDVRVTWEYGDAIRFVKEASEDCIDTIVAAGGDGTINEVVNGLMFLDFEKRPNLAILPMGTANDFATSCNIPEFPIEALRLAIEATPTPIDIVKANDRYFINVATGGIGAEITAQTPTELKNFLGGGAYTLSAVLKALNFTKNSGRLVGKDIEISGNYIAAAICNGRQAGGGQVLAPSAFINDGLFDVVIILEFPITAIAQVLSEILQDKDGEYVKRFKSDKIYSYPDNQRHINLDGEPYHIKDVVFELMPQAIHIKLPKGCPLIINQLGSESQMR